MKRSLQEIVELVVFGLIALLLGTGLLWLVGWLFGALGAVFIWFAGVIWALLRFIVPVAVVAGIVYLVVRLVQQGQDDRSEASTYAPAPTESVPGESVDPGTDAPPSAGAPPPGAAPSAAGPPPPAAGPDVPEAHPTGAEPATGDGAAPDTSGDAPDRER